jgi:hypothetical protein
MTEQGSAHPRLIQWNQLDFRISAERVVPMIGDAVVESGAPITELHFEFHDGLLRIEGKVRKAISIPFTVEIEHVEPKGKSIAIPLRKAAAFGIPLPGLLLSIAQSFMKSSEVSYDSSTRAFIVRLDRFLPPFVDVDIQQIRLVAGGIAVRLGPGGADPPAPRGGDDGESTKRPDGERPEGPEHA